MPLFNLDIEKYLEGEWWTNRYVLQAADIGAANTAATSIYNAERAVHKSQVLFTKYRVSDRVPLTDVYTITQTNAYGLITGTPANFLPLFNVMRVDFSTAGGGRPSRKYLRLPVDEGQTEGGKFTQGTIDSFLTGYVNPVVSTVAFVDVDGQTFNMGTIHPFVGMRQLRRGTKRKLTSIL